MSKKTSTDAIEIIDDLYFKGRPEMLALLEEARERLRVSMQLHELREKEGLSLQQLADRVGTSRSVISRLESPGYEKHTLSTLRRVAGALGCTMRMEFVPVKNQARKTTGGRPRATRRSARAAKAKA